VSQSDRPAYRVSEPCNISHLLCSTSLHRDIIQITEQHFSPTAAYWLLECKLGGNSQWLVFTHVVALCAACEQIASHAQVDEPIEVYIHAMKGRKAAGLLFTRHPERLDLAYRVLEIVPFEQASEKPQRWVFDAKGRFHYHQGDIKHPPLPIEDFAVLAEAIDAKEQGPQQLHWWHDGEELFLLAKEAMPALSATQDAWCQADGLWQGAVSPLWYSCSARWLKTHFWRPLGKRYRWHHLDNIEPYRRQAGHLYLNAQFALVLLPFAPHLHQYLPPDWQHLQPEAHVSSQPIALWRLQRRLLRLQRRVRKTATEDDKSWHQLWHQWMLLDQVGEQLAALVGELHYLYAQTQLTATAPLSKRFGADPLLPLVNEDKKALLSLERQAGDLPETLSATPLGSFTSSSASKLYQVAMELWHILGGELRKLATTMGLLLAEQSALPHPDAIYFLYFDELWELVHQQRQVPAERLTQRQHQYMQAALSQASQWQLAGKAYQGGELQKGRGLRITGISCVSGQAQGKARLVHSSWCLNEINAGEVIIVKHYHPSWLPWFAQAKAILLVSQEDALGALTEMAATLNIPLLTAVEDGLSYFNNNDVLQVSAGEDSWVAHIS